MATQFRQVGRGAKETNTREGGRGKEKGKGEGKGERRKERENAQAEGMEREKAGAEGKGERRKGKEKAETEGKEVRKGKARRERSWPGSPAKHEARSSSQNRDIDVQEIVNEKFFFSRNDSQLTLL